jgi:hypothetical protein
VTENLQGSAPLTGTIGVTSNRNFTITGYANTSHGPVTTSISQQQKFSGTQTVDFDTVNFTVDDQHTDVDTSVLSSTTVSSPQGTWLTQEKFSFPINIQLTAPVSNSNYGLTVATTQKYQFSKLVLKNGIIDDYSSVTNRVQGSDVQPTSSSQRYTFLDLKGQSYDCEIASANNVLTSVSVGCKH